MSLKAATFASIITNPMNTYKFEITIPEINYTTIIESCDFPAQGEFNKIELWYKGESITYPALPKNGGEWKFTIPESDNGVIKQQFDDLAGSMYNQKTGVFVPRQWKTIIINCQDLADKTVFVGILHDAWFVSRANIALKATDPAGAWKWDYTFYYNWFEDGDITPANTTSPIA